MDIKEKILQQASELFLERGVKNVTMDILAGELGISKRTLYEHFRDKDEVVIQSLRFMIMEDNKELLKIVQDTDNVVEAIVLIFQRQKQRRTEFPKVFTEDIKKYFHAVNATFYSCREDLKKFSASFTLLEKGVKQGIFRKDLRIELVDNFIHEIISLIHNSERISVLQPTEQEVMANIFLPYFRGICTEKGLHLMNQYFNDQHDK